jgi:hypothetical protein
LAPEEMMIKCGLVSEFKMWKLVSSLALFSYLAFPNVAGANYVIKLKNGNEFVTARYWQQGKQVMFDTYGGVFGVDRAFVTKIEQSDKPFASVAPEEPEARPQAASAKEERQQPEKPAAAEVKADTRRDDDPITQEFNRLKERSKGVDGMLTSEIRELLGEITAFKTKIRSDRKLFVDYAREFNEAQELGNLTETALRSRGQ